MLMRVMQDNADLRLAIDSMMLTPGMLESLNRISLVPGTPAVGAAAEAAILRALGSLAGGISTQ
jgi:hypothetical protein